MSEPIGILQNMDIDFDFPRIVFQTLEPIDRVALFATGLVSEVGILDDLGAEPPEPAILVEGFKLGDLGLKRALVEYPDGSRVPFWGFCCHEDETLVAAIARTIGSGKLVNDAGEELILPDITGAEAAQISLSRR